MAIAVTDELHGPAESASGSHRNILATRGNGPGKPLECRARQLPDRPRAEIEWPCEASGGSWPNPLSVAMCHAGISKGGSEHAMEQTFLIIACLFSVKHIPK